MPQGSQEGLDINAAVVVEQGLNTLAAEAEATEGQVPTVGSDGKVEFASGGGGLQAGHGCAIQLSNGVHAYNKADTITWDAPLLDTDGYFTSPGTEITIPIGFGGIYLIAFNPYLVDDDPDTNIGEARGIVSTYNSFEDFVLPRVPSNNLYTTGLSWVDVLPEGSTVDAFVTWTGPAAAAELGSGEGGSTISVIFLGSAIAGNF